MREQSHPADDFATPSDTALMWVWKTQSPRCRCYVQRPGVVAVIDPSLWRRSRLADQNLLAWFYTIWGATRLQTVRDDQTIPLTGRVPIGPTMALDPPWQVVSSGHTFALGQRRIMFGGGDPDDLSL